jgi:hypothetical protein
MQLQCPEIEEFAYLLKARTGCPYDKVPPGPGRRGLILAATASILEADLGTVDRITDGCPLACTPNREPCRRCVFVPRAAKGPEDDYLRFGQEFFLQVQATFTTPPPQAPRGPKFREVATLRDLSSLSLSLSLSLSHCYSYSSSSSSSFPFIVLQATALVWR